MDVTVRNALPADLAGVYELLGQLWPDKEWGIDYFGALYSQILAEPREFAFCALHENKIVGFCAGSMMINLYNEGHVCYISTMIVDSALRGMSIGSAIIREVSGMARAMGCKAVELDTGFHRVEAHAFYEKLGFKKRAYTFSLRLMPFNNSTAL